MRSEASRIAAETRRICAPNGLGNHVVVWPMRDSEGRLIVDEATGPNDNIALLHRDGSRTLPLARFSTPHSAEQVIEALAVSAAAATLGRLGGLKGGKAKVRKGFGSLTPQQRSARAREAAQGRWGVRSELIAVYASPLARDEGDDPIRYERRWYDAADNLARTVKVAAAEVPADLWWEDLDGVAESRAHEKETK